MLQRTHRGKDKRNSRGIKAITNEQNLSFRLFFFSEINRFEEWHRGNLPIQKKNGSYDQAGFSELSDYYGSNITLNNLSKGVFSESDIIVEKSVVEVYIQIQINAGIEACNTRYRELINQK